ncbi:MAG: tRNA 4-thiouridine(8) synthase ThiI [Clostridiales bacterium]|nr:tRNA 4-thiouridine(8) synthase ThiI [Clostridiales bacterium]
MNEQNIYIVRCGEVALKGTNKPYFERVLVERVKKSLKDIENATVKRLEGLIYVRTDKLTPEIDVIRRVSKVFGVASISPAIECESNLESLCKVAVEYMNEFMEGNRPKTFKIKSKRADKNFPTKSPEIAKIIGECVLEGCKDLKVDVHNPECVLFVDVRHDKSYIYQDKIKGFGGLPVGTNGKGLVLFSGGIDSPVAAFMMAKRGMTIEAVHYHSYPYTSQRAQEKVEELVRIISQYCGDVKLHVVNLLPIQEQIVENCPEDQTTLLVRRFMMRIAEKIAKDNECMMLITGENLGQVASQTAEALVVTDETVKLPVMRPLIGMDKIDIMDMAHEIETYETSILPYEDCCTVFLPKHPLTRPRSFQMVNSESKLDVEKLVSDAVQSAETVHIKE